MLVPGRQSAIHVPVLVLQPEISSAAAQSAFVVQRALQYPPWGAPVWNSTLEVGWIQNRGAPPQSASVPQPTPTIPDCADEAGADGPASAKSGPLLGRSGAMAMPVLPAPPLPALPPPAPPAPEPAVLVAPVPEPALPSSASSAAPPAPLAPPAAVAAHSHSPRRCPSSVHTCVPLHRSAPMHACRAPGTQARSRAPASEQPPLGQLLSIVDTVRLSVLHASSQTLASRTNLTCASLRTPAATEWPHAARSMTSRAAARQMLIRRRHSYCTRRARYKSGSAPLAGGARGVP
jgi:hypothetical protein